MENFILYHAECNDGFASALVYHREREVPHKDKMKHFYYPVKYGDSFPKDLKDNSCVYILDFSYSAKELLELSTRMKQVVVIDHHKTAFDEFLKIEELSKSYGLSTVINNYEEEKLTNIEVTDNDGFVRLSVYFNLEESGASLCFRYFRAQSVWEGHGKIIFDLPILLKYIRDRDLWKNELENTHQVTAALNYLGRKSFVLWEKFMNNILPLVEKGKLILGYRKTIMEQQLQHVHMAYIDQYLVPVVNTLPQFASDLGNLLCEKYPDAPFSASYYFEGNQKDRVKYSLRSKGSFDVSALAKQYGGDGHKNAAGFRNSHFVHFNTKEE